MFNASIGPSDCDVSSCFFSPNDISTLISRVEEYKRSGKDRNIVDPDPNGLYTKRKQQRHGISSSKDLLNTDLVASSNQASQVHVSYPENGWGCSLSKMPMLIRAVMDKHIHSLNPGKTLATRITSPCQQHSGRPKRFLKMNIFVTLLLPVISNVFTLRQSAVTATEKKRPTTPVKIGFVHSSWRCAGY